MSGHVVFRVGRTAFAVAVPEVQEVVRSSRLILLPGSGQEVNGRALSLCDIRGRSVPVIDLRRDPHLPGDVLLPVDRAHVGAVVDRVVAVVAEGSLAPETDEVVGLPSYATGVLRPVPGSDAAVALGALVPVLLVTLPDMPSLAVAS